MEGPRGLPFSYIKALLAFSFKAGRKEKDEEDGVESGRNLPTWKTAIEEIFCSTIYGPQITKERKKGSALPERDRTGSYKLCRGKAQW
jgi:hypothetical protein